MKLFHISRLQTVVVIIGILCITMPYANSAKAQSLNLDSVQPLTLAENNHDILTASNSNYSASASDAVSGKGSKPGHINFGTLHKYFGYGTLAFAAAAAATGSSGNSFHKTMGHCTTGMAALTATTGWLEYADDLNFKDGFTFTNIHAILGSVATVGFITNSFSADDDGHNAIPATSAVLAFGAGILIHF